MKALIYMQNMQAERKYYVIMLKDSSEPEKFAFPHYLRNLLAQSTHKFSILCVCFWGATVGCVDLHIQH